ncbi:hypothetical protein [Streptomyces sp. NRRL S-1521]|uniref:hypothetical protein n=1 Tax=Streptomyces sp. NRRL S-1521 TaxID=1609100 RepID=UPI000747C548|nr:hypothetical protein [Streptomyces sp. NRRL S-1521]KUL63741.1 hypothetical protein ADL30_02830 [Streptomyces sp. NRRL S-1521]
MHEAARCPHERPAGHVRVHASVPGDKHGPPPGVEGDMSPRPRYQASRHKAADKLLDKVALITGGDSGSTAGEVLAVTGGETDTR